MPSPQYSTVLHKRSSIPGAIPSISTLSAGELAINELDAKLFVRTINNTIETFLNEKQIPYKLNASLSAVVPQYGNNVVSQVLSNVLGGYANNTAGAASVIVNGELNSLSGDFGFIGSGTNNTITSAGDFSAILGGHHNLVSHANTFILGTSLSSHAENFTYVNNISGTYYGDGSNLTGIITSVGGYISLSGGTLTGGLTGTEAVFNSVSATKLYGDGSSLTGLTLGQIGTVSGGSTLNQFVGNGITQTYSIQGFNNLDKGSYLVSIGGIDQPGTFWNISASNGGQITFNEPPKNGEVISVRVLRGVVVGATGIPAVFSSVSAGVFLGDGSGLTGIASSGTYLPLSGGIVTGSIQADSVTDTHGGTLVKKKSFKIIGDGTNQQFTLNHNFNTYEILGQVYEYDTKEAVMCYSRNTNLNNTLIDVGSTLNAGVTGFLVVLFC